MYSKQLFAAIERVKKKKKKISFSSVYHLKSGTVLRRPFEYNTFFALGKHMKPCVLLNVNKLYNEKTEHFCSIKCINYTQFQQNIINTNCLCSQQLHQLHFCLNLKSVCYMGCKINTQ